MEECGTAGQVTDDKMTHAHCMLEQTLMICITYCFSVQQWLHERAVMLRLYVHCPSFLLRTAAVETVWCVKAFQTLLSKRRLTMTFSAHILGFEIKLSFITSDAVAFCVTGTRSLIRRYQLLRFT